MGEILRMSGLYTLCNKNCMNFKGYMDYMRFLLSPDYMYTRQSSKFDAEVHLNC